MRADDKNRSGLPGRLQNKVAWVTGAGSGLGRAIAIGLAREGSNLVLTSRTKGSLVEVQHTIETNGGHAKLAPGSVADPTAVRGMVGQILEHWEKLDVVVNCAGVSPTFSPAEDLSDEHWQTIIDINLSGTFFCCREAGRVMLANGGSGSIINISSVHAAAAFGRLSGYAASKGGIEALTRALALEWASQRIRVNAIAPGYFLTPLSEPLLNSSWRTAVINRIPLGRIGNPDEVVEAVLFLAGDGSSYVTGSTLSVDGGWTAS